MIVQTIHAARKQTFNEQPRGSNASAHALEHKVQMEKKQQTMSAPAAVKRITTMGTARVALPTLPTMSTDAAVTPLAMAGMAGQGLGLGVGMGGGGGGGGGNGGGFSLFGLSTAGSGLPGTFFDLKQTPNRQPTPIGESSTRILLKSALKEYQIAVTDFVANGMNDGTLISRYFKGPTQLYAPQIFIPRMNAKEGPKAFNLASQVEPSRWLIHYKGAVLAPESGTYRFVGVCDDVLVVRFNGKIVLDCGSMFATGKPPERFYAFDGLDPIWVAATGSKAAEREARSKLRRGTRTRSTS